MQVQAMHDLTRLLRTLRRAIDAEAGAARPGDRADELGVVPAGTFDPLPAEASPDKRLAA